MSRNYRPATPAAPTAAAVIVNATDEYIFFKVQRPTTLGVVIEIVGLTTGAKLLDEYISYAELSNVLLKGVGVPVEIKTLLGAHKIELSKFCVDLINPSGQAIITVQNDDEEIVFGALKTVLPLGANFGGGFVVDFTCFVKKIKK